MIWCKLPGTNAINNLFLILFLTWQNSNERNQIRNVSDYDARSEINEGLGVCDIAKKWYRILIFSGILSITTKRMGILYKAIFYLIKCMHHFVLSNSYIKSNYFRIIRHDRAVNNQMKSINFLFNADQRYMNAFNLQLQMQK